MDPLCGGRARHPGVETRPEISQWQVKLRRKDEDKEGWKKVHPVVQQAKADLHRNDRGAEGCQQFQSQRRKECDAQHAQRRIAELVADRFDILCVRFGLTEDFQGC